MINATSSYFRREFQNMSVQRTVDQMPHIQIQFYNFLQKKKDKFLEKKFLNIFFLVNRLLDIIDKTSALFLLTIYLFIHSERVADVANNYQVISICVLFAKW